VFGLLQVHCHSNIIIGCADEESIKGDPAEKFFDAAKFRVPLRATNFENQIRDQLNACNYSHEKCPKREKAELPTRVIDVLPSTPRLYLSRPNDRAEYVTLSYCWGGPQDLTTSTATLNDRKSAIPISLLPPGLQDSISITRLLGFQYLWVDALCILQDSIKDKAAEIAKMAAIYRNASMTIAAANTSSVKNSFLRDIVLPATCELPFLNPDRSPGTISLGAGDIASRDLEPLSTRAWTLQESLLSPRVLYFGNRDVTWKCLSELVNITKVNADYDKFDTYEYRRHPPFLDNFLFPDAEMFSRTTTRDTSDRFMERSKGGLTQYGVWTYIMEDYSRRSLSVQADRLPALAGIAGELQKMWQDTYIVGMWRKCFLQHLGWRAYDDRGAKLATNSQSPTWLWITAGFRVHVEPYFKFECARIRDIDVHFAQPDASLGEILSGKIILEGEVSTLKDIEERQTSSWEHEHWDIQECVTLDRELGGEENEVNYETRFLLLGCYSQYRSHGVGLILNPFGDGTWRRIGLTYTHEDDLNMMPLMWPRNCYQPQVITVV
jgi:hypothetical protein